MAGAFLSSRLRRIALESFRNKCVSGSSHFFTFLGGLSFTTPSRKIQTNFMLKGGLHPDNSPCISVALAIIDNIAVIPTAKGELVFQCFNFLLEIFTSGIEGQALTVALHCFLFFAPGSPDITEMSIPQRITRK